MSTNAQSEPVSPKPKRRWFQFRLRTLLGMMTLLAAVLALIVVPAERQRRAVAAIESLDGFIIYDNANDPAFDPFVDNAGRNRAWYRKLLGEDYFSLVNYVGFGSHPRRRPRISDAELEHLEAHLLALTGLKALDLGSTQVTDAGLEHVTGLTQLEGLDLCDTEVTDAGLAHLKGLTQLASLDLRGANVSDAGLKHLKGLTSLEWLNLRDTQVTDAGTDNLKASIPGCSIHVTLPAAKSLPNDSDGNN